MSFSLAAKINSFFLQYAFFCFPFLTRAITPVENGCSNALGLGDSGTDASF